MKTRALTGFFFVIVMLASVLTGAYTFTFFYLLLSLFCLNEFYGLINLAGVARPNRAAGILLALALLLPCSFYFLWDTSLQALLVAIPIVVFIYIAELYSRHPAPFNNLSYTFSGIIYTVLPFLFFHALAFSDGYFNSHYPLAFLLLLWANDTGAYLFGIKFGKHRLFERHSPKKSWEGFFGGMFIALVVAFILSLFFKELVILQWAAVALIVVVFGTFGDLTESMLKRSLDVKDSGQLLPGHGGLLDRFDGLLFAAPMVFVYLYWIKVY